MSIESGENPEKIIELKPEEYKTFARPFIIGSEHRDPEVYYRIPEDVPFQNWRRDNGLEYNTGKKKVRLNGEEYYFNTDEKSYGALSFVEESST